MVLIFRPNFLMKAHCRRKRSPTLSAESKTRGGFAKWTLFSTLLPKSVSRMSRWSRFFEPPDLASRSQVPGRTMESARSRNTEGGERGS